MALDASTLEIWGRATEERENQMSELEDFHEDIIGKAMRGLGIGKNEMAHRIGTGREEIEGILKGAFDERYIRQMASELSIDANKLLRSARREWLPAPVGTEGVMQFNSSYHDMTVNAYLAWDDQTKEAWIFDTGTEAYPIVSFVAQNNLKVKAIFLTHTHLDHIACLQELRQKTGQPLVFVHQLELLAGCEPIDEGFQDELGSLSLEASHTHGHSVGGVTYFLNGLTKPIAFVGDAVFAGSMGGGMVSYGDALRTNREKIMTLPNETILCPGHGPMTTVMEEKKHNPFFPEFKI